MIVDLFAGPGGWDVGLQQLGLTAIGLEKDAAACATRSQAGHLTIRTDVSIYPTSPFKNVIGLIASPPCQDFSVAGKRAGIHGYRGRLVYEVLRWTEVLQPEWIACEQVEPVLPIWQDFGRIMRERWGYFVWTGVLNVADFGVPQVRKRAILMASRRRFAAPRPTHTERPTDDIFGSDLRKWITMAEALGWGLTKRPAGTVASSTEKGGPHGLDGGSKARAMYERAQERGFWQRQIDKPQDNNHAPEAQDSTLGDLPIREDVLLKGGMWSNNNRLFDPESEPSPVVAFGHDAAGWAWIRPATTVVSEFRPDVIAAPGWRTEPDDSRQNAAGSIKVTIPEISILQSFPPDYPWAGSKTKKYQQIGNAVPPLLARAVLHELVS